MKNYMSKKQKGKKQNYLQMNVKQKKQNYRLDWQNLMSQNFSQKNKLKYRRKITDRRS